MKSLPALLVLTQFLAPLVPAATFLVTTTDDQFDTGAELSLREAIRDANLSPEDDIILLLAGTYTLTIPGREEDLCATGDLDVADNGTLTILGEGAAATIINGGGSATDDRVLHLPAGGDLSIENCTITGGNCTDSNNRGGGISSWQGNLTLSRCLVADNHTSRSACEGGGIYINDGDLTLTDCTVSGNSTTEDVCPGGAIFSRGPLTLTNCTIANNHALGPNSDGGGIFCDTSSVASDAVLTNCTIDGNSCTRSGGGLHNWGGLTRLVHCTVTGNQAEPDRGGGISSNDNTNDFTELAACIVRDNLASDLDPVGDGNNHFVSLGDNIVGTGGALDGLTFIMSGDRKGTSPPVNLAPLGHYGGPTPTRPPLPPSPAIDSATSSTVIIDQRGIMRPLDGDGDFIGVIDVGAVEAGAPIIVNTAADELADPGTGTSLREALALANQYRQTIIFDPGLNDATIPLSLGQLEVRQAHVIDASMLTDGITIDGGWTNRCLDVDDEDHDSLGSVYLRNLTISNGYTPAGDAGGANILNYEDLIMEDCLITGGHSEGIGGGILSGYSTLTLTRCTVSDNESTGDATVWGVGGGGIFISPGTLILTDCSITGNHASGPSGNGGGVSINAFQSGHTATINNCTIRENTAAGTGGALYASTGSVEIHDSTIEGNTSSGNGAGICSESATCAVSSSTIADNISGLNGGGIWSQTDLGGMTTTVTNSTITGNVAAAAGGGLFNLEGLTELSHCTITANTATGGFGSGVASWGNTNTQTNVGATIIAGNTNSDVDRVSPGNHNSFASDGFNLIGSGNATGTSPPTPNAFVQVGDTTGVSDPGLAPPAAFGGPTLTMHPLADSPAIDGAGATDTDGTDQRGFPRFVNGAKDIGAVETGPALLVTTTADSGAGSLRAVIDATPEPGRHITFDTAVFPATINLTGGELPIDSGRCLFIDASNIPGSVTIDAGQISRILHLDDSSPTAVIHSLTITGGWASYGGGIYGESGSLTILESTIEENGAFHGGGICASDLSLTLANSTVAHNLARGAMGGGEGGGLWSEGGNASIVESTIMKNRSWTGGGLHISDTTLDLSRSTISDNTALVGAGLHHEATDGSAGSLSNSTICGNTAFGPGGGIHNPGGCIDINHCTITGNISPDGYGSGVASGGEAVVENSIIAGNLHSDVDLLDSAPADSFASLGHNLIGTGSGVTAFNEPGDLPHTSYPYLAPLGEYGGPTRTMHPLAGSAAIDGGNPATTDGTDQRGLPRSVDGDDDTSPATDIGAVEAGPLLRVTSTGNSGSGTLRQRLVEATAPGQHIVFDGISFPGTIHLGSELVIEGGRHLFIDASDIPGLVTIDAIGNDRVLAVRDADTIAALHSLALTGGQPTGSNHGGGIYNRLATLTVAHCSIHDNTVTAPGHSGGGIYNWDGTLLVTHSAIFSNQAALGGGGLYNLGGALLEITHSTISGNSSGSGGGIYSYTNSSGATLLHTSTIADNAASTRGGGLYNFREHTQVFGCTIADNEAPADMGGGIFSENYGLARTTVTASIISTNSGTDVDSEPGLNSVFSGNYNLIGSGNATGAFSLQYDRTDITRPLLAPFGYYFGPGMTMPPLPGSPAIDHCLVLSNPYLVTDQRTVPRMTGSAVDAGAVEAFPFSTIPLADTDNDGIPDLLEGPDSAYPHLTVGADDSGLDTDGDGHSDATEIADMTDLYDPTDYLRILDFYPAAGFDPQTNPVFVMEVNTFPGLEYELETSPDLATPFATLPASPFTATGQFTEIDVHLAPGRDFVRVRRK